VRVSFQEKGFFRISVSHSSCIVPAMILSRAQEQNDSSLQGGALLAKGVAGLPFNGGDYNTVIQTL